MLRKNVTIQSTYIFIITDITDLFYEWRYKYQQNTAIVIQRTWILSRKPYFQEMNEFHRLHLWRFPTSWSSYITGDLRVQLPTVSLQFQFQSLSSASNHVGDKGLIWCRVPAVFVHHVQIPNTYLHKPQVKTANQRIDDDHQIKHTACEPALGLVGDSFHAQPRERPPSKRLRQESPLSAPLMSPSFDGSKMKRKIPSFYHHYSVLPTWFQNSLAFVGPI